MGNSALFSTIQDFDQDRQQQRASGKNKKDEDRNIGG
jgi:hypothetical protein